MKVIRDRAIVDDDWTRVDDAAPLPASGRLLVSWARWQAGREALKARGKLGVAIPPTVRAVRPTGVARPPLGTARNISSRSPNPSPAVSATAARRASASYRSPRESAPSAAIISNEPASQPRTSR